MKGLVDDTQTTEVDLAIGMKVRVEGTINDDGVTGTATSVLYDDDVEGPVSNLTPTTIDATVDSYTFDVLGVAVMADRVATSFDDNDGSGFSFESITNDMVVEVSGYFDGTQIAATRIEKQLDTDDEFEIKGTIVSFDGAGGTIALELQTGAQVSYDVSDTAEVDSAVTVGSFVEVELMDDNGNLIAIEIEPDDDDLVDDEDDEVSILGILIDDGAGGFIINGFPLDLTNSPEYEPASLEGNLVAGLEVKVEGQIVNGVLIAEEIETEEGEIEIEARVTMVTATDAKNGTVTLDLGNMDLNVTTNSDTLFEDESAFDSDNDDSFDLTELNLDTDFVEIEAYQDDTGTLIATRIKREDADEDESQETTLEAPIDSFVLEQSVTLLGITYEVDGNTEYELSDDTATDATTFFNALTVGTVVKVKDVEPLDNIADELDLEEEESDLDDDSDDSDSDSDGDTDT